MTTYRTEFSEALTLLAVAADRLVRRGHSAPVLVGGAAVELYTGGRITSGDFDFVSQWQSEFFAELEAVGFERPQTVGWLKRSLWHPMLKFDVQVVSGSQYLDRRIRDETANEASLATLIQWSTP